MNQGNQIRAFKYDAEGRLLFEKIPEQTPTIADGGVPNQWTTAYTYTSFGAVATKTDARGVISTYVYDTLHRLISISYNTVSGVTTAPAVTYNYDNNQSSSTKGLLLSMTVGTGYSENYAYDSFKRVQSVTRTIDTRTYTTSYQLNTANQLTQITYPSNRVINIGHDNKGRATSVSSYLSSVTYNGIGQIIGTTLGNGVSETYGYEANRMQWTSQVTTKSGGATGGLMNVNYGYQASAGQMGAGSTAGNAGQLLTISGTINSTTESGGYTYDLLGRLVTSSQTSNGANAQRRFAYDRWGNRTGVWDAVTGGNQIQSIALQQSGGVPTNQIASVTSASTVNYTHDTAGNVTNDGVHSYGYDSENRLVSVDGGATATYAYDQSNQRYKKVSGVATTHYIWQSSQVIAEHDGGTGAVITDYVYSGSRMVAKVSSGVTQYFLSDRLSVRMTLDASGNVLGREAHLPFGEDFAETGNQEKHHFTSYERDSETGTDYAVNRQYSAAVGRFNRPDPFKGSMILDAPQSFNRYAYTGADPINNTDPLGLFCSPSCYVIEGRCICPPPPPPPNPGLLGPGIVVNPPTGPTTSGLPRGPTKKRCSNQLPVNAEDQLNTALNAASAALTKPGCALLVGSLYYKDSIRDKLSKMREHGKFKFDTNSCDFGYVAEGLFSRGRIYIGMLFFDPQARGHGEGTTLPNGRVYPTLTPDQRQALTILHELAHKFGGRGHLSDSQEAELDEAIVRACL